MQFSWFSCISNWTFKTYVAFTEFWKSRSYWSYKMKVLYSYKPVPGLVWWCWLLENLNCESIYMLVILEEVLNRQNSHWNEWDTFETSSSLCHPKIGKITSFRNTSLWKCALKLCKSISFHLAIVEATRHFLCNKSIGVWHHTIILCSVFFFFFLSSRSVKSQAQTI